MSRIHFGTLETQLVNDGIDLNNNNVNISNVESETLELSSSVLEEQVKHAQVLRQLEMKRIGRTVTVPTDDNEVKNRLRSHGHPVCLFGEREGERRSRLRELLASDQIDDDMSESSSDDETQERLKETFYTPASHVLIRAREDFAVHSFSAANSRLAVQRQRQSTGSTVIDHADLVDKILSNACALNVSGSQVGDRRPLNCCAFGGTTKYIATGAFSGVSTIWDSETSVAIWKLNEHSDRIVDLEFAQKDDLRLATASADGCAKVWLVPDQMETDETTTLKSACTLLGHAQRLSCIAWHPMHNHIGTSSYDRTWRLWDVQVGTELLLQEGHESAVYAFAIHGDGSLVLSGDLGGVVRLWDLRSGKSIDSLRGHVGQVLSADFAGNGYLAATGGSDHTARIWDLRMRKSLFLIPAHQSLVSTVAFEKVTDSFLATSSFDGKAKLWSTTDGKMIKELIGHENKIMDVAVAQDASKILTASYDRTWKLWSVV